MNDQDDSFNGLLNNDGRISEWFKTNHSQIFEKSIGFESSHGPDNQINRLLQFEESPWDQKDFNKKAIRKEQNRQSSRRAREKKKDEYEKLKMRITELQRQNQQLREKKICSWCKRSLDGVHQHYAQICTPKISDKESKSQPKSQFIAFEPLQEKKPRRGWNPKVWIALGVIMLIIGLQLFGFGEEQKPIKIREKDMRDWSTKIFEEGPGTINIKMKSTPPEIDGDKNKSSKNPWKQKINWFERIEIEDDEDYQMQQQGFYEETDLQIDKDLLYSIQAQFDEIGRYI